MADLSGDDESATFAPRQVAPSGAPAIRRPADRDRGGRKLRPVRDPASRRPGLRNRAGLRRERVLERRTPDRAPSSYSTIRTETLVWISRMFPVSQLELRVELPVNSTVRPMICVQPLVVVELPVNRTAEVGA